MSETAILPLALTVMLGPQILVGMLLIMRKDAIKSSLIYILSIVSTLMLTTFLYYKLIENTDLHNVSMGGRPFLKYVLILFFIILIIRSVINRNKITKPPKWMKGISSASLSEIFFIGFFLIAFMPTDVIVAFSVGNILNGESGNFWDALPFFGAVLLVSLFPLTIYFSLGRSKRAKYLENVNNWLNTHGYLINVVVMVFFIILML
ncbi:Sap, sulfolipid-1-addressing protein [Muriicola jejuensis]|uniref:GAP family protein n=1 Tax=Muriicola jejuensis TaxID=504488 RepID=A0A6P0U9G5_9FLAO|nr:GAP family protein [Muriicola jejuensis]NER09814.1 hypothetical protein [Muriicola jejuensis]SMP05523.1 Sap, sulfolipid-1-addressing protein [Muriicola jejuensis]